jgi:hypothetical protein
VYSLHRLRRRIGPGGGGGTGKSEPRDEEMVRGNGAATCRESERRAGSGESNREKVVLC